MISVLLADDDMLVLGRLHEILSGFNDVRVTGQASNGREAIDLIEKTKPNIVILDMDMPILNGVQVAKQIAEQRLPIKILALSNYDSFDFVKPIMKLGATDYILKHELSPELLRAKIDEMKTGFEALRYPAPTKREKLLILAQELAAEIKKAQSWHQISDCNFQIPPNENLSDAESIIDNHALIIVSLNQYCDFLKGSTESRRERIMQSIQHICGTIFNSISNGCIQITGEQELTILFDFSEIHDSGETIYYTERYIKMIAANLVKILKLELIFAYTIFSGKKNSILRFYRETHDKLEAKRGINDKNTNETDYPETVRRILDLIHAEFGRDISLTEIAQLAGLSEPYVSKLFKTTVGVPFIEYLCDFRIIKAKTLLKITEMSVKDIASVVGFRNYNYFINVFKSKTGNSPAEFRKIAAIQPE